MSTIAELQERAYRQSADKGFHDDDTAIIDYLREAGHPKWAAMVETWMNGNRIALQHSELSEALEELRKGKAANDTYYPTKHDALGRDLRPDVHLLGPHKPEGVPSEMADVVIRVLDFCGSNDIDLEAIILEKLDYNASRSHKHGGKKF